MLCRVLGGLAASIYSRYRPYLHYLLEYRDEQGMHIMLIHHGKTYAQYEVMIASPWGSSARGRRRKSWLRLVSVSVLAFAKVSFNIQRLSTVELRRLCMYAS